VGGGTGGIKHSAGGAGTGGAAGAGGGSLADVKKTDDGKKAQGPGSDSHYEKTPDVKDSDSSDSPGGGVDVIIGDVSIESDVVMELDLPPADPGMNRGHDGGGGSDIGGHKFQRQRPPGVTPQDMDLVGPAVRKKTGPDDEEQPVAGGTSGAASAPREPGSPEGDLPFQRNAPGGRIGAGAADFIEDLRNLDPIDPSKD
jgi:hypothetical protein